MNFKHLLFLLSFLAILNSCSENTDCCPMPEPDVEFPSGVFVLNEGNFGSANASVSFVNEEFNETRASIFTDINGEPLGDTAQSIELFEQLAFIVVNVSNKIEIVNRFSFQSLRSITNNLNNPRYAKVVGNKLYVSNWADGNNPDDDYIAVFNLGNLTLAETIPVAEGPEKMVVANNTLYVAHPGGFSFNNIITVIETETNSIIREIEVGDKPNSLVIQGIDLWVLSSGKPSYADEETAGSISKIDIPSNELTESFEFPDNTLHPSNLNIVEGSAYFTLGKSLYRYNFDNNLPETAEYNFDEVSVLYGFEIHEGKIYIASPRTDFTGNGDLFIYDLNDGSLLDQYSVGINPNGVYFN